VLLVSKNSKKLLREGIGRHFELKRESLDLPKCILVDVAGKCNWTVELKLGGFSSSGTRVKRCHQKLGHQFWLLSRIGCKS